MPYLQRNRLEEIEPAQAADLLLAAHAWRELDAPALEQIPAFQDQADHPFLQSLNVNDPKIRLTIGHHMLGASLNSLQMPVSSPLRLNALWYPAFKRETLVDEAGNATVRRDVDNYPSHLVMTGLLPIFESEDWRHPFAVPPAGFGKNGDYLCSAVLGLKCPLDRFAMLPLAIADLNRKFLDYRCDLETASVEGATFLRLGGGVADLRLWTNRADDIARVWRADVAFEADPSDYSRVKMHVLQKPVPGYRPATSHPLSPEHLKPEALYLGQDLADGADQWVRLNDLTHTLIAGETGSGKSTWTVSLIEGLIAQKSALAHLYLCDLKQVEFAGYADRGPSITVVDRLTGLFDVIDQVHAAMVTRLARAKAERRRNSAEPFIVLVIDEFANLTLMDPFLEGDEKKRFKQTMNRLLDIGMRARSANIRLIISLQHPIDKHIPSALKFNCPTKVMFRVPSRSYIALMFGDADEDLFPVHPRDLTPGQGYFQRPGEKPRLFQGPYLSDDAMPQPTEHQT